MKHIKLFEAFVNEGYNTEYRHLPQWLHEYHGITDRIKTFNVAIEEYEQKIELWNSTSMGKRKKPSKGFKKAIAEFKYQIRISKSEIRKAEKELQSGLEVTWKDGTKDKPGAVEARSMIDGMTYMPGTDSDGIFRTIYQDRFFKEEIADGNWFGPIGFNDKDLEMMRSEYVKRDAEFVTRDKGMYNEIKNNRKFNKLMDKIIDWSIENENYTK